MLPESVDAGFVEVARNLVVYLVGVGMCVAGAVGIIQLAEIPFVASVVLFVLGICTVIYVHEYLDGPV